MVHRRISVNQYDGEFEVTPYVKSPFSLWSHPVRQELPNVGMGRTFFVRDNRTVHTGVTPVHLLT